MSDQRPLDDVEAPAAEPTPADAGPSASTPDPRDVDLQTTDLDELKRQYAAETETPEQAPGEAGDADEAAYVANLEAVEAELDRVLHEYAVSNDKQRFAYDLGRARFELEQRSAEISRQVDAHDALRSLHEIRQQVDCDHLSDETFEKIVGGLFDGDERIQEAFRNRYAGPGGQRAFTAAKDHIARVLRESFGPRYDGEATSVKDSIVAVMTGGERSRPQAAPFPSSSELGQMSSRDFGKLLDRYGIKEATRIE